MVDSDENQEGEGREGVRCFGNTSYENGGVTPESKVREGHRTVASIESLPGWSETGLLSQLSTTQMESQDVTAF